jgi:hypothetical protein
MPTSVTLSSIKALPVLAGRTLNDGSPLQTDAIERRQSRILARAAHLRRELSSTVCTRCSEHPKRSGECVVLEGSMQGKRTNCHWAQDGTPCVFLVSEHSPPVAIQIAPGPSRENFRPGVEPIVARWAERTPLWGCVNCICHHSS